LLKLKSSQPLSLTVFFLLIFHLEEPNQCPVLVAFLFLPLSLFQSGKQGF